MASLGMQFDTCEKGSGECSHHGPQETDTQISLMRHCERGKLRQSPLAGSLENSAKVLPIKKKKHLFLLSQQYVTKPMGEAVSQPLLR